MHPTTLLASRRGWFAAILLIGALALGLQPRVLPAAVDKALEDLVFVTDDLAPFDPGCDAISLFDASTGAEIVRGDRWVSPGRLAVTPDGALIVAMSINSGPFVYVLARATDSGADWRTFRVSFGQGLEAGQPAISPDGEFLLLPLSGGSLRAYRIADIRREIATGKLAGFGQPVATFSGATAASVVVAPDSSVAYLVATNGRVYPLNLPDLTLRGSPIPAQGVTGSAFHQILRTYAAISPDGRYLAINTANRGAVVLVDLAKATSQVVNAPGLSESHGVAFNASGDAQGLLAIHGRRQVGVYTVQPDGQLALLASVAVPPQSLLEDRSVQWGWNRGASVAWTGRGDGIIAAIGGIEEFRVFDFRFDASATAPAKLEKRFDLDSCTTELGEGMATDVITLNGRLPPPTPTSTLAPSPTDSPVPTPSVTATSTSTSTPTAILSSTPTASRTASSTPTVTPSATATPAPLYLPLLLREHCIPDQRRVDVVLVIDASSSMRDPTSTGRPKIAAALDAARNFIDQLQPARGDQAAIVAFNADAALLQPLTTDRAALASALARIQIAPQTCLVCGVEVADAELASPHHRPDHAATMIVLTDGRSNPRPAGEAVERAAAAKARGVTVFTIGLGDDLDSEALTAMASQPAFAYRAPDAEDLADIYRAIAVALPCPAGAFWGGR